MSIPPKENKYRVSLSIPEMKSIHLSLSRDLDNIIENAELIGWIGKQIRKAEFQVLEASHQSGPSSLTLKGQAIAEKVINDANYSAYLKYKQIEAGEQLEISEQEIETALIYKMENSLTCGSLTEDEQEVANAVMTKKLMGL